MQLFGKTYTKGQILRRVGEIGQIGGVRRCRLAEGRQDGVDAVDFRTGGGLNFTVLPGRGMDISFAEYQGILLNWRSSSGVAAGSYFEPQGWVVRQVAIPVEEGEKRPNQGSLSLH